MTRKALLFCGIVAPVLYVVMIFFVAMQWEAYSSASQTISELSAIGAPTRPLWTLLGAGYTVLVIAFGWGIFQSAGRNWPLRVVGILFIAHGLFGAVWPPMHQRAELAANGGTLTDTLHIVWSMVTVLFILLEIGFGAAALGDRFRVYSIATAVVVFAFGMLTGSEAPNVEANLATPWIGVWERINVGAFMLWVAVLAVSLLRMRSAAGVAGEREQLAA